MNADIWIQLTFQPENLRRTGNGTPDKHTQNDEDDTIERYFLRPSARRATNPAESNTNVAGSGVAAPGPETMNSCP